MGSTLKMLKSKQQFLFSALCFSTGALLMLFFSGTFDQEVKLTNEQSLSSHVTYNGPITRMLKVKESLLEILNHLTNIQSIINVDCFVTLGFLKNATVATSPLSITRNMNTPPPCRATSGN